MLTLSALLLLLAVPASQGESAPGDGEYRAALEQLYDGHTDNAIARLAGLAARAPDDPLGPYFEALALCWKAEQRPDSGAFAKELERKTERVRGLAQARLAKDPRDARARVALGAAHAVRSRFHFYRLQRREGTRAAVRMREELLRARELDPDNNDVLFGLGLYDYYADVLPRLFKMLRFLTGIPGGNRRRGLALIESARAGSSFHGTEALVQLYEIHAFYEAKPDLALEQILELRTRYPGSPLWALKLAEHQRERLGLYAESVAVAREVIRASESGHPNYSEVAAALARLSLGESLLRDLRLAEARRALLELKDGVDGAPWLGPRARLLLGRSLELEGDRDGAEVHYRLAAASPDRELRRRAEDALSSPLPAAQLRALALVAEARRLREEGRRQEAVEAYRRALKAWPKSQEAALRVAEDDLGEGRLNPAREALARLAEAEAPDPPWVGAWSRLLLAQVHDLEGERSAALHQYKKVYEEPYGRPELKSLAAAGIKRPFAGRDARPSPRPRPTT